MNDSKLYSQRQKWHNKDYSITIKVPPLGVTFIKGIGINEDTMKDDVEGEF